MNGRNYLGREKGLTLVELLVGLGLGLLLLLGVAALFTQNKQSYRANEDLARLQEDARFALEELGRDISMAGFFAESVDPTNTNVNAGLLGLAGCSGWFYLVNTGLIENAMATRDNATGANANALFPCIDSASFQAGTDVIGVKRTAGVASGTNVAPATAGPVYMRENGTMSIVWSGGGPDIVVPVPYRDWEYKPRIYYVRDFANIAGDGIPTLCRLRPADGGAPATLIQECLAQGVEDLQLEFGIDTNEDGAANAYVTAPTANDLVRLVSVRIYLLMRTANLDVGYTDDRTYQVSNKAAYTPGDRFHRRLFASTVMVRNVNNLRQLAF